MLDLRSPPPLSGALVMGLPLRLLPTFPLAWFLRRMVAVFCRHHPGVTDRLSDYAGHQMFVDPSDLPLAFGITLREGPPEIAVFAEGQKPENGIDACVRGTLADLTALLEGQLDGDALFFSRQLQVTGDMELVLALRNALDDARVDLRQLLSEVFGRASPFGRTALDAALKGYARLDRNLSLLARSASTATDDRLKQQAVEIGKLREEVEELRRKTRSSHTPSSHTRSPRAQRQQEETS